MMKLKFMLGTLVLFISLSSIACLWDKDTLWMENQKFPMALELITGKFRRHSPHYYQWRRDECLKRITKDPKNLLLLDDLAVAYEKLGEHDEAIAVAKKALALAPERYETWANLGTFYIHKRDFVTGLKYLKRAVTINPDAHFGRERYQIWLVEYVQLRMDEENRIKLPMTEPRRFKFRDTFTDYLKEKLKVEKLSDKERNKAVKGILGMMYFGNFESPVLLEALAVLLYNTEADEMDGPQQIAARALLKASYGVADETAKMKYRKMAEYVLEVQLFKKPKISAGDNTRKLKWVEFQFKKELQEAEAWFEELTANEKAWVAADLNVTKKYREVYKETPKVTVAK